MPSEYLNGYLYPVREYLRPWKLACLFFGIAVLAMGSFLHPAPDWDVGITIVMAICTYVTGPPTMRVLLERRWQLLPVAALATWISVDGIYALYWYFVDSEALALMRSANWPASLPLYGLCGLLCLYRGSLRELVGALRAAAAPGKS